VDLLGVFEAARRHWMLILAGVVVGVLLAIAVMFRVSETADGRSRLVARTQGVYETRMRLMIDDPNLGLGRVDGAGLTDTFGKTIYLAPTYAFLMTSDEVLSRVEDRVGRLRESVDAKAQKDSPIITVTVRGTSPQRVVAVAKGVAAEFAQYLDEQQRARRVPDDARTDVVVLTAPRQPGTSASGAVQYAALVLLSPAVLCLGAAIAIESVRRAKSA